VPDFSRVPAGLGRVRIPEQRYVVFNHPGHVSGIRRTWATIWNSWFPASAVSRPMAPNFERYGENFDSQTGDGGVELWIPIRR